MLLKLFYTLHFFGWDNQFEFLISHKGVKLGFSLFHRSKAVNVTAVPKFLWWIVLNIWVEQNNF